MKKIIAKISAVLQVVLLAPIKLPGKALNILKYIALGLGVVETVLEDKDEKESDELLDQASQMLVREDNLSVTDLEGMNGKSIDSIDDMDVLLNNNFNKGEELRDESE